MMGKIVIDESRILQLEEDRVTLRNNLRSQGVVCTDDETIESLIAKVNNVQGFEKYFDKSMSGDVITNIPDASLSFAGFNNLTSVAFLSRTSIDSNKFYNMGQLKRFYSAISTSVGQAGIYNNNALESVSLPSWVGTPSTNQALNAGNAKIIDLGSVNAVNTGTPMNKPNFKNLILRRSDDITSLSATSVFNSSIPFIVFAPNSLIPTYENSTNWSALSNVTFKDIVGSRYEGTSWLLNIITNKCKCTLDGNEIEVLDNETVAIFKHTENISHVYEDGVELQDTDLVKGKTLTSTV